MAAVKPVKKFDSPAFEPFMNSQSKMAGEERGDGDDDADVGRLGQSQREVLHQEIERDAAEAGRREEQLFFYILQLWRRRGAAIHSADVPDEKAEKQDFQRCKGGYEQNLG